MTCGCNGGGSGIGSGSYGAAFGAVVGGKKAVRVRTKQLARAAAGERSGINTAARVAAAYLRAARGRPLRTKADRLAADKQALAVAKRYRKQLKAIKSPVARLSQTAIVVVRALGGTDAEARGAATYVVGRATGQITVSPAVYLRSMAGAGGGVGVVPSILPRRGAGPVVLVPGTPGAPMRWQGAGAPAPSAAPFPRFPGVPAFPRAPIAPSLRLTPAFTPPARRVGSFADDGGGEDQGTTPASRPMAPRLPGLLPRVPPAFLRSAGAEDEAEAGGEAPSRTGEALPDLAAFRRNRQREEMADIAAEAQAGTLPASGLLRGRFSDDAGADLDLPPASFRPPTLRDPDALRQLFRRDDGDSGPSGDDLDAEAAALDGFGDFGVWDRWRTLENMSDKIDALQAEIRDLERLRSKAASDKKRRQIDYMIEYRRQRIADFKRGIKEAKARKRDRAVWYYQQGARFSGVDFGAPIGASAVDAIKPYLLPLSAAGLLGYLVASSWRGLSASAAPSRRARRNTQRRISGK